MRAYRTASSISLVGLLFATGCESFTPPVSMTPLPSDRSMVLNVNSNRRASYLLLTDPDPLDGVTARRLVLVSEPPPDTALETTAKLVNSLSSTAGTVGTVDASLTNKIVELTQRTQAVVILRDSLFRLAEARANGFIDNATWEKKFQEVLTAAQLIAAGVSADSIAAKRAEDAAASAATQTNAAISALGGDLEARLAELKDKIEKAEASAIAAKSSADSAARTTEFEKLFSELKTLIIGKSQAPAPSGAPPEQSPPDSEPETKSQEPARQ